MPTEPSGDGLDLGGIRNFIQGRHLGTSLRIKVESNLDGAKIPLYFSTIQKS
jgi:hypothetical protein